LNDVTKDPRVSHYDLVKTEGLRSFVSVPLKTTDRIIGVMNVASRMPGQFSEGDLYLLTSIGHHIGIATEQAGLYERLARASERYQTLLQRSLTAQEEERKRIARELHDETSQLLTSLALSLQAVIGIAEARGIGDGEFMEKLKRAHSHALHAGSEVVKLMKELRPTLLDELGMAAAIRRYTKDTLEPHGITIDTEFLGTEQRIWPEAEVTLFRVAQGAVGNILKHSEATRASIRLECTARECVLQVEDDGKGFDVKKVTGVDSSGRGAGLFTMKERVKLIGGFCHIDSGSGRGTRVFVKVPLTKDAVGEEEDKGADS
jgi:signal transduction histidine kinase